MRRITGKETFRRVASAMVVGVVCALLAVPMPAMARKKGNDGPMRGAKGVITGISGKGRDVVITIDGDGGGSRATTGQWTGAGSTGSGVRVILLPFGLWPVILIAIRGGQDT